MSKNSGYIPVNRQFGDLMFSQLSGRSDLNLAVATSVVEGLPDEQRTSPVRRTFLLLMVFDILLCFVLWIIYVQHIENNIMDGFRKEVIHCSFESSLFDTVLLAAGRFLVIEFAYGIFRASTPWWSAMVTAVTSSVLVAKCFMFNFHDKPNASSSGLVYAVLIAALILTWLETSFLIYRVIPQEKAAYQVISSYQNCDERAESQSLLGSVYRRPVGLSNPTASLAGYYTPLGSVYSPPQYKSIMQEATVDIATMLERASILRAEVWYLYKLEAWGPTKLDYGQYSIRSCKLPGYPMKVFRVEVHLDAPAEVLFNDFVYNIDATPSWNRTVDYVELIQSFPSEQIDVIHNVVHEALGGAISRRDFVLLRHWGEHDDCYFVGHTSVEHPKCGPINHCVRAQQLIGAFIIEPSVDQPTSCCRMVWIMCFDLKLYLPQRIVDKALESELTTQVKSLCDRAKYLVDMPAVTWSPLLSHQPPQQRRTHMLPRLTPTLEEHAFSMENDDE